MRYGIYVLVAAASLLLGCAREFQIPPQDAVCPSPGPYPEIWKEFYCSDTEPAHISVLVHHGVKMLPYVCQAIQDKDMFLRRYAIGALGYYHDTRALQTLDSIMTNSTEIEYFRGDALEAIYVIDQDLGRSNAVKILNGPLPPVDFLRRTAERIINLPGSIDLNWKEEYGP